jgi:hypothetical protein
LNDRHESARQLVPLGAAHESELAERLQVRKVESEPKSLAEAAQDAPLQSKRLRL